MRFFFFNDTATTEIYTLSLHDALPISPPARRRGRGQPDVRGGEQLEPRGGHRHPQRGAGGAGLHARRDRKSTRLNSSHANISYAVFCLKKKTTYSGQSTFILTSHAQTS